MKKIYTVVLFVIMTAMLNAQAFQWVYQNPLPQGADLNDVAIAGINEIVAVGNAGIVMKSSNEAQSWSISYIDTLSRDINKVCFVNGNLGFVCGNSGLIMKTTNAGDSWTYLNSGTTSNLNDVAFYNADSGYAVGANGTILKTTNGGQSWNASTSGTSSHYAVYIVNPALVLIGSSSSTTGRFLVSTNFGSSWQNITPAGLGTSVYAIRFFNATVGFFGSGDGSIYKTTDAGLTWVKKTSNATGFIEDFNFVTPTEYFSVDNKGYVVKSTDAGETWTATRLTTQKFYGSVYNLSAAYAVGSAGTIFKSNSTVTEWTDKATYATQQHLREIEFIDGQTGLACGGATSAADSLGQVLKTTDGGLHWTVLPYNFKSNVYSISAPSLNVWYVATGTKVFKTTDGGANFNQLTTPVTGTSQVLWIASFLNENVGAIAGNTGKMYKTTDGGATWTTVTTNFGTTVIYGVQFFSPEKIIISGGAGKVSKTTDGGATWTAQTTGLTGVIFGMEFKDEMNGYIGAGSQGLAKTTDGGATWVAQTVPSQISSSASFWDIGIADSAVWACSVNGDVIYSRKNGPWRMAQKVTTGILYEIATVGNDLYVCGNNGVIIKGYSDPNVPVELTSFTAALQGSSAVLNWRTATETNNRGFEIEKKASGSNWQKIAFIKGAGSSADAHSYSYVDRQSGSGITLYRLKQIDFDGSFTYSSVAEVNNGVAFKFSLSQNYPNPFNPVTKIRYTVPASGKVTLKIFNILGREVATLVNGVQDAGEYKIDFNASDLASGIYFYELRSGNYTATRKMTLLK